MDTFIKTVFSCSSVISLLEFLSPSRDQFIFPPLWLLILLLLKVKYEFSLCLNVLYVLSLSLVQNLTAQNGNSPSGTVV